MAGRGGGRGGWRGREGEGLTTSLGCRLDVVPAPEHLGPGVLLIGRILQPGYPPRRFEVALTPEEKVQLGELLLETEEAMADMGDVEYRLPVELGGGVYKGREIGNVGRVRIQIPNVGPVFLDKAAVFPVTPPLPPMPTGAVAYRIRGGSHNGLILLNELGTGTFAFFYQSTGTKSSSLDWASVWRTIGGWDVVLAPFMEVKSKKHVSDLPWRWRSGSEMYSLFKVDVTENTPSMVEVRTDDRCVCLHPDIARDMADALNAAADKAEENKLR